MKAILLLIVDGSDTGPIAVVKDLEAARARLHDNAMLYSEPGDPDYDQLDAGFAAAWDEQFGTRTLDELRPDHPSLTFDVEWESGVGSWDYRMVEVDVEL